MGDKFTLTGKNEIKIFILFLLNEIDYPLDYDELGEITVYDNFVGYFDFAECFSELLSAGHLIEIKDGETVRYTVSPTGRTVASQLQDSIMLPIREKAFKTALHLLSFKRRNAKVSCSVTEDEGRFYVRCTITEHDRITMDTTVATDSKLRAEKMKNNFLERPEVIFKGLSALLACEVDYLFS